MSDLLPYFLGWPLAFLLGNVSGRWLIPAIMDSIRGTRGR